MNITNTHGISLPLAVWLLHDDYDYNRDENYISATSMLKATKQIILGSRVKSADREADVSDFLAQRIGHAVHDSIEKAWRQSATSAMKKLGYPDHIADNIRVNPTLEEMEANPDIVPVWIEQRVIKEVEIDGVLWKIGGKFDMIIDGRLFDTKTTSVWAVMKGNKDDDYSMQGSIYKWLNPERIESEHIYIQFIFTDWQRSMARSNPKYPQIKAAEHVVEMKDHVETERFIKTKIREVSRLKDSPEEDIPPCTDKELWRSEPTFKYYLDPEKAKDPTARSTKNCDTLLEAEAYKATKGGKGIIVTKMGEPKACEYCPAFDICKQGQSYFAEVN